MLLVVTETVLEGSKLREKQRSSRKSQKFTMKNEIYSLWLNIKDNLRYWKTYDYTTVSQQLINILRTAKSTLTTYNHATNTLPLTKFHVSLMRYLSHFADSHNFPAISFFCPSFDEIYNQNAISRLIYSHNHLIQKSNVYKTLKN